MAATTIGYNEDLCTKILLLLPAKSVLRFKTVSKLWLSIISSHRFRQIHSSTRRAATATGLFLYNHNQKLEFLSLDNQISSITLPNIFPFSDPPMIIKSSAGGLLLLLSETRTRPSSPSKRQYFVCNPATKEFQPLDVPQVIKDAIIVTEYLVFDPSKSPHYNVVFHYHHRCCNDLPRGYKVLVHSPPGSEPFSSPATISATFFFSLRKQMANLHSYDISREWINHFQFTFLLEAHCSVVYLGESRGRVHIVTRDPREISLLKVYEFKRRDSKYWSLKYQVDLSTIEIDLPCLITPFFSDFKVLSVVVGEEEEDSTMVLAEKTYLDEEEGWYVGPIVACNLKTKLCNVLTPFGRFGMDAVGLFGWWRTVYEYIPTLACV